MARLLGVQIEGGNRRDRFAIADRGFRGDLGILPEHVGQTPSGVVVAEPRCHGRAENTELEIVLDELEQVQIAEPRNDVFEAEERARRQRMGAALFVPDFGQTKQRRRRFRQRQFDFRPFVGRAQLFRKHHRFGVPQND